MRAHASASRHTDSATCLPVLVQPEYRSGFVRDRLEKTKAAFLTLRTEKGCLREDHACVCVCLCVFECVLNSMHLLVVKHLLIAHCKMMFLLSGMT